MVLAVAGALGAQPVITATPASVSFAYQIGTALPAVKTVAVKASTGHPAFTTAVGALWLTASPDSGSLNGTINIFVNPTSLPVGSYASSVTVTVAGVVAPVTIPVNLSVTAAPPILSLSSTALTFVAPPTPSVSQTIKLTTTSGAIPFTAVQAAVPWMTVTPSSGVVLPSAPVTLTVAVDATMLNPQALAYTAKIVVTANGVLPSNRTQNITVALTVHALTPTLVSLWPSGSKPGSSDTTITIRGTNFTSQSVVSLQGVVTPLKTTYISPSALDAVIPAAKLAVVATLNVLVTNPAPGGASAGTLPFAVTNSPIIAAAVNAASYSSVAISPGVLMTMFGTSLGPVTPASMADADLDGFVDTTLGGVSVTIDGVAAPMVYVSQNQVTVQVPYEAAVGLAKAIVLTNGGLTANSTVDIAATGPGLFAIDAAGIGQAAALNFDATTSQYTINSSTSAAKVGDTVRLYITGEGDYATLVSPRTGLLVTAALSPLPQVSPLPTVTIGGAAATVSYAGPVVGSMIGALQIDCVIPAAAVTGTGAPLVVTIGGVDSQAGITLAIKP